MKIYDVQDILNAGCNLEPLKCRKCKDTKEVTFNWGVADAFCATCGTWQLDELLPEAHAK